MVDASEGILGIEWIDGQPVRKLLPGGAEEEGEEVDDRDVESDAIDPLQEYQVSAGMFSVLCICLYL